MTVFIRDFEVVAHPQAPGQGEGAAPQGESPPARPCPDEVERVLRKLREHAARVRAH